ncbi:peptidylprolyl isomerase [Tahibacter soli]|uniref:peptidylprolyl isomerase n=1 Tax=Tahibacter soli TaxID=2983605 RepID=A0A9X4BIK5_9GAMM|nr:peptidylprolyl isomerase [Tahibacter soli]MDC8011204.1 hypothetical protein [Tahibacter soli]
MNLVRFAAARLVARCGLMLLAAAAPDAGAAVVARVDGDAIGSASLAVLVRYARLTDRAASGRDVLDAVIERRLLARHALATYPVDALFPERRVAFAPDVAADERLVAVLRAVYRDETDAALTVEAARRATVARADVDADALRAALGDPARLRVEYALDDASRDRAAALVLLRYRMPGGDAGALTLADLYARQNVQGRMALHNLDVEFLDRQVDARLAALLVVDDARRRLGRTAVAELRRALADQELERALGERYGLGADLHDDSAYLAGLRARVTADDIARWYDAHRERFRRVDAVRVRHIRLADEATALRVAHALAADGSNFGELARRHSIAPDGAGGGDLGWIDASAQRDWFGALAFAQPPWRNGAPVREPVKADAPAAWEIVRVDEQRVGWHAKDSETVRYLASRDIAEQRARAAFAALRDRLRVAAKIAVAGDTAGGGE